LQSRLHIIARDWSSTYSLQENYRFLEVYYGFKKSVNIVPQTLVPNFEVQEPIFSATSRFEMADMSSNFVLEAMRFDIPSSISPRYIPL